MLTTLRWSTQWEAPTELQFAGAYIRYVITEGPMNRAVLSLLVAVVTATLCFSNAIRASGTELEEAVALLKQMHADQCQQQKLRGSVMLAHRNHDEETLNELWPKVEAISKRLKPAEDKLNVLKASIKKNPDDQSAFETALLRQSDCG